MPFGSWAVGTGKFIRILRVRVLERRGEEEEKEKKKQVVVVLLKFLVGLVHVSGCDFELNPLYIKGFYGSKCLGLEPLKLKRFRVGKTNEKNRIFGGKGWGVAPASALQQGL
uniref:Uncharacterized protein n=1 Tax=Solanum tuberosum TaxID=4113 RepID=M1DI21_SOLTU